MLLSIQLSYYLFILTVKAKHAELVPDKVVYYFQRNYFIFLFQLSEEQFWVQFFQSQKFHRNRLPQKPKGNELLFQELLETDVNGKQYN